MLPLRGLLYLAALLATQTAAVRTARAAAEGSPGAPAFVIDAGAHVTVSGTTCLVLDCDLRNGGAFEPSAGSAVVLVGFGAPLLTSASFADLGLALHGTATIANDAAVTGTLTLGSGWLSLAGHDLTVAAVAGGAAASYLVTPDTLGRLARTVGSGASVLFPVGHAGYDPVSVHTGTGSDVFRVAVLDAPPATGLDPSEALTRAWAIAHGNASGVNGPLTIALQWNAGEAGPSYVRDPGLAGGARAWRWLNGAWAMQPGVLRTDNGAWPAVDTLVTADGGLWTLASIASLLAVGDGDAQPSRVELAAPAPDPLRGTGWLRYGLPRRARVSLALYSVLGQRVATLVDAEQEPGWHAAPLDGARLAAGIYFLRLAAGPESRSARLVVIR